MINPKMIPPEVVEAAARAICEHLRSNWVFDGNPRHSEARDDMLAQARAAIAAGLAAWPGLRMMVDIDTGNDAAFKLPLPTENSND